MEDEHARLASRLDAAREQTCGIYNSEEICQHLPLHASLIAFAIAANSSG